MKVLIYARCSTDESRQDVEVQLKALRQHCQHQGWEFDEISEYGSGYKGDQPKLAIKLVDIQKGLYSAILVYAMDRFSREHPRKVDELLNRIVFDYRCRFISLSDGIDSADEVKWHIMRHMMTYFANVFSRRLSEKVKRGIAWKKEQGIYRGGRRPKKSKVDIDEVKSLYKETSSFRAAARLYNESRYGTNRISRTYVKRVIRGVI